MKNISFLLLFLAAPCFAQISGEDAYGGLAAKACPNAGSGFFYRCNFANHLLFADPSNNLFVPHGVYVVDRSTTTDDQGGVYNTTITTKYGSAPAWADKTAQRLQNWGLNLIDIDSNSGVLPVATDASYPLDGSSIRSIPHKVPFNAEYRADFYGMKNNYWYLSEPLMNVFSARSARYAALGGFVNANGEADYSNTSALSTEALGELNVTGGFNVWQTIRQSQYNTWMMTIFSGDSDEGWFRGATDVFATVPAGHNSDHGGWFAITASPLLSADNGTYKGLFQNNVLQMKKRGYNYLLAKYGAVPGSTGGTSGQSLNTQWGSAYPTLGTTGSCQGNYYFPCQTQNSPETFDTANGSKTTFSKTLLCGGGGCNSGNPIAAFSLQLLSGNATVIAGDNGSGTLYGPCISSGTVNYTSGSASITWSATCTGTRAFQRIFASAGTATMVYGVSNGGTQSGCIVGESVTIAGTTNFNGTFTITGCSNIGGASVGGSSADGYTIQFALAGTPAQETSGTFVLPTLSTQTLTAQYIACGWGCGTGFIDEDGRAAHASYVGTQTGGQGQSGLNGTAAFNADADQILKLWITDDAKTNHDAVKAVFPNHMFGGPATLGTWSLPSRCVVLQAYAPYVDLVTGGGEANYTQPMLDHLHNCLGDIPVLQGQYLTADAQSALSFPNSTATRAGSAVTVTTSRNNNATTASVVSTTGCSDATFNSSASMAVTAANSTTITFTLAGAGSSATGCTLYYSDASTGGLSTQATRGTTLQTNTTNLLNLSNSINGIFASVGWSLWRCCDDWSERLNWGLVTNKDNAYDGVEDVVATNVTCSAPLNSITTCGGENGSYGNYISSVTAAARALDNAVLALQAVPVAPGNMMARFNDVSATTYTYLSRHY